VMRGYVRMLPLNCDPQLGLIGSKARCPHCNQFHLRPGFCQAVHKASLVDTEAVHKPVHKPEPVHKPVHKLSTPLTEPEIEPDADELDATEKRKAYKREWMRKRRGDGPAT